MINVAIYGASGYTGSELVRLLSGHPHARITALSADSNAGKAPSELFPQFSELGLPALQRIADIDLNDVDVLFCALPHGTTQTAIAAALEAKPTLKIVDLSADFRLRNPADYTTWYGDEHRATELQREAVYGLTEHYRDAVANARLVANPGCHTTTALMGLLPPVTQGVIDTDAITIMSSTGMSGAGRSAKVGMLFSELSEGFHAYAVSGHRHTAELDQELSRAAGHEVIATFTPHLVPMNRGIYSTINVRGSAEAVHASLADQYADEPFVTVLPLGEVPHSRHVRGSNSTRIGVVADRKPGRALLFSTTDNLLKGASGQAVQNMNVMCGFDETEGLSKLPVFP